MPVLLIQNPGGDYTFRRRYWTVRVIGIEIIIYNALLGHLAQIILHKFALPVCTCILNILFFMNTVVNHLPILTRWRAPRNLKPVNLVLAREVVARSDCEAKCFDIWDHHRLSLLPVPTKEKNYCCVTNSSSGATFSFLVRLCNSGCQHEQRSSAFHSTAAGWDGSV